MSLQGLWVGLVILVIKPRTSEWPVGPLLGTLIPLLLLLLLSSGPHLSWGRHPWGATQAHFACQALLSHDLVPAVLSWGQHLVAFTGLSPSGRVFFATPLL